MDDAHCPKCNAELDENSVCPACRDTDRPEPQQQTQDEASS